MMIRTAFLAATIGLVPLISPDMSSVTLARDIHTHDAHSRLEPHRQFGVQQSAQRRRSMPAYFDLLSLHDMASSGADGSYPTNSMIVASNGNLYGTTLLGGSAGYGTFYKVTTSGDRTHPTITYNVLHNFYDGSVTNDGFSCYDKIAEDGSGNLYGSCRGGGTTGSYGIVYKITPSTSAYSVIYRFSNGISNDGQNPDGGLIKDGSGNLYGTTSTGDGTAQYGTIFKLTPSGGGWSYSVLYRFAGGSSGQDVTSLLLASDGNLYGTTEGGGANGEGIIWRYNLSTSTFTKIADAPNSTYGAGIIQIPTSFTSGGRLEFWGTTKWGGANGYGSIYQLIETSPGSGSFNYNVIHDFNNGTNEGYAPIGDMLFSTDIEGFGDATGAIYGTTYTGGISGSGSVFRIDYVTQTLWEPSNTLWTGAASGYAWGLVEGSIGGGGYGYTPVLFGSSDSGGAHNQGWLWFAWLQ